MTLETAKQKSKRDIIRETEFKLDEVEMKLSQMRKSITQVAEGSCFFYLYCRDETCTAGN